MWIFIILSSRFIMCDFQNLGLTNVFFFFFFKRHCSRVCVYWFVWPRTCSLPVTGPTTPPRSHCLGWRLLMSCISLYGTQSLKPPFPTLGALYFLYSWYRLNLKIWNTPILHHTNTSTTRPARSQSCLSPKKSLGTTVLEHWHHGSSQSTFCVSLTSSPSACFLLFMRPSVLLLPLLTFYASPCLFPYIHLCPFSPLLPSLTSFAPPVYFHTSTFACGLASLHRTKRWTQVPLSDLLWLKNTFAACVSPVPFANIGQPDDTALSLSSLAALSPTRAVRPWYHTLGSAVLEVTFLPFLTLLSSLLSYIPLSLCRTV